MQKFCWKELRNSMSFYTLKIYGFVLLVVSFSACGLFSSAEEKSDKEVGNETEAVSVKTILAKTKQIPTYLEATGNLSSDAESNVAPTIGGKILRVNFDVGSYVRKGEPMVELDSGDAKIMLNQAIAQSEQQKESVRSAEAGVEQAKATLRQNQARLGLKTGSNFNINEFSQVISVAAQLKLANQDLKRNERLLESGDVSRQVYDRAKSQRDSLLGQLKEARSNAAVAIKAIQTSQAAVESAKTQVRQAKAAVSTSQTQIAQARKAVRDNIIYAPISGYISERNADPGEFISPSQPNAKIATIVRTAILRLKIDVPEQDIAKISVGQGVSAQVSAYPDRKFAGTVTRVLPSLDTQSRTLTVEAEVENVGGLLKPGQFATVRVTQSKPETAVMVPASAVRADGERSLVFVVKDGIANERVVQTGLLEDDEIEIKAGVQENEVVAINNVSKLGDGVIVNQ